MADRQFTCPIPRTAQMPRTMVAATIKLERVALKWRDLAERKRTQFVELYRSGRWRHYYTDREFADELNEVFAIARRWAKIAPKPEDLQRPSVVPPPLVRQRALPPAA